MLLLRGGAQNLVFGRCTLQLLTQEFVLGREVRRGGREGGEFGFEVFDMALFALAKRPLPVVKNQQSDNSFWVIRYAPPNVRSAVLGLSPGLCRGHVFFVFAVAAAALAAVDIVLHLCAAHLW